MPTRKNISRIRIAKDVMKLELSPPAKVLMLQMKIHDDSDPYIAGNKAALTRSETALALVELRVKNIIEEHGKTWRFKSEWL
jgi:hypothetical protein